MSFVNVSVGTTAQGTDGAWHKLGVSLDYNDMLRLVAEGNVPGYSLIPAKGTDGTLRVTIQNAEGKEMSLVMVWHELRKAADKLLIAHQLQEGIITQEQAKAMIARV